MGIIFAILSGLSVCIQGAFNSRVSEKVGIWETTAIVHGVGLLASLAVLCFAWSGDLRKIGQVNFIYLLGGAVGVVIVSTFMRSISLLGMTFAVALMLITQLIAASLIDNFGLFGCAVIKFDITKFLGLVVMIAGIVIFKIKG